jgi:hypothetical protein
MGLFSIMDHAAYVRRIKAALKATAGLFRQLERRQRLEASGWHWDNGWQGNRSLAIARHQRATGDRYVDLNDIPWYSPRPDTPNSTLRNGTCFQTCFRAMLDLPEDTAWVLCHGELHLGDRG